MTTETPNRQPWFTRRRLANLFLVLFAGGLLLLGWRNYPREVEIRFNFVQMERGPKHTLTFRDLQRIVAEVHDADELMHRAMIPAPIGGLAAARLKLSLKPGTYTLTLTFWFAGQEQGIVRDQWKTKLVVVRHETLRFAPR